MDLATRWSNLFVGMSPASFFNFSFLPKYGVYFLQALGYTLLLAVISVLLAVIPALLLAFMRLSKNKFVRGISGAYIAIFRSTPLLVQLSIIYFGFFGAISIPRLYIFGFIDISRFIPGVVALALNSSAYVAEIFRAGILAVDAGQTEAARSLGLSATQAMKLVVLPQAIKNVLPALGNEVVTMVKESSICSTLGMVELMFAAKTVATSTYISLAPYVLAALMYAHRLPPRMDQRVIWGVEAGWAVLLGAFLQATGKVPLAWWIPCMAMAILSMLLFLWVTRSITLLEAGYVCARAFILAELAASVEWQLHCVLWPQRGGAEPLSLLLLAAVYGGIFAAMLFVENRRPGPAGKLKITPAGTFVAVVMALTAFAVSNLSFANGSEANMNMFYIRTLVDLAGVLILTVQHEQLREAALHSELAELDGVLHRQYEQYKQSKENIRLINRRYHELKMQIAAIRAERDHAKQDVALAAMESGIRQYEAENKTGNPVLDTLLTAKSLYCQQHHITMTCVADGHLLDFLETGEICTIVGTALDNATESVETEPDHEKRLIRVAVYAQNGFVMLRFENYCAQEVELGADGLPRRNTHGGSDLRGVRAAAEKRGGTMTLHWENEWFTLRVLLPQKS